MSLIALTGLSSFLGDLGLGTPAIRRVATLNAEKKLGVARGIVGSVSTAMLASSGAIAVLVILSHPQFFTGRVWMLSIRKMLIGLLCTQ